MPTQANDTIGADELDVVTDRGYYKCEEILTCEEAEISTCLPSPYTPGNIAKGYLGKWDSIYTAAADRSSIYAQKKQESELLHSLDSFRIFDGGD